MSQSLLSSKIVIQEEEPTFRPIAGAPSADAGMVGVCERGPVGVATRVQSFSEYKKTFGGYTANADGALYAQNFFDEAGPGANLWIVRTCHYSDVTDGTTFTAAKAAVTLKTDNLAATPGAVLASIDGPYSLAPADTLIVKVDGGGTVTATYNATAAARQSSAATFNLADGQTLTLKIDGGATQTFTFHTSEFANITAATAAEVVAVIAATISGASVSVNANAVKITSSTQGTSSGVNITGGSANGALGFTTGNIAGTGNVANIAAVTTAEIITQLASAVGGTATVTNVSGAPKITSATTGGSSSVQVTSGGTAQSKVGFDTAIHSGSASGAVNTLIVDGKTPGAFGNDLQVSIAAATSGDGTQFNLTVLKSGANVEPPWTNLSMDPTSSRYAPTILNDVNTGSDYISVTDEFAVASETRPLNGTYALAGGNDGLASLGDTDFIGNQAGANGIRAFDTVASLRILFVANRATAAVQNAMLTYCEATRYGSVFAFLDSPAGLTAAEMLTYAQSTASLVESSEFGAIHWPRVKITNPNTTVFGNDATVTVGTSGLLAGICARNDQVAGGVYEPPAGIDYGRVRSAVGLETDEVKDETKRDLLAPAFVNPVVGLDNLPIHVDGSDTLKSTGDFPTIGERRGVIYIEQSIKAGLVFAKHRKIKTRLLAAASRATNAFLLLQLRNDAFASDDPKLAYNVDFSAELNPPSESFAKRVNGVISLATAKPAKWIVLRVGQDTRALEQELAQAAA